MSVPLRNAVVAIVHTSPQTIHADYRRLLSLAGMDVVTAPLRRAILVPRHARRMPFPGSGTPPWQLEIMTRLCQMSGITSTATILSDPHSERYGYTAIAAALGSAILRRAPPLDCETLVAALAPGRVDARNGLFGTTHALAALFHPGAMIRNTGSIGDALEQVRRTGALLIAVTDATTISDGRDAGGEYAEIRSTILASRDPVALDAIVAAQFGLNPLRDVAYLRKAHLQGLGTADLRAITCYGDVEALKDRWGLVDPVPGVTLDRFSRWTGADMRTFESWLYNTAWGRLFQAYQMRYIVRVRR
ncbi:MAG: hypothetical protein J7463_10010 [Roseiflexus sp.]|jgi:hypothetical protein|nr:hypothetical protein [Roseiflexus sp.]MBO9336093.1 hypothetical protein [Roseiflexus sp.]MBO9365204.1 hypothetical protein [Roseiflexus sp.]MBO9383840.1 hypothetical protein [Roseiflexus sp.]MBO9390183.1 hypothetical protein [Roseiflexus sp.]